MNGRFDRRSQQIKFPTVRAFGAKPRDGHKNGGFAIRADYAHSHPFGADLFYDSDVVTAITVIDVHYVADLHSRLLARMDAARRVDHINSDRRKTHQVSARLRLAKLIGALEVALAPHLVHLLPRLRCRIVTAVGSRV